MNFLEYQNVLYSTLMDAKTQFEVYVQDNKSGLDFNTEFNFMYSKVLSGVNIENSFPYTPLESIKTAFLRVAKIGLSLDPRQQLCYIHTEFNASAGCYYTVLDFGYKGLLTLTARSGKVVVTSANVFYENDTFCFNGQFEKVTHKMTMLSQSARGYVAGGYCETLLKDGTYITTVMPPEELMAIEEQGKASGNEAWLSAFVDQMRSKTLIKRHWKTLCTVIYSGTALDDPYLLEDNALFTSESQAINNNFNIQGEF